MNDRDKVIRLRSIYNKKMVMRPHTTDEKNELIKIVNFLLSVERKNTLSRDEILKINDYTQLLINSLQ